MNPPNGRPDPRVGILIPTHNRVDFLRNSLGSAIAQRYSPLEILVIDNCSDDGTGGYVRGVSDPRVRYVLNDRDIGLAGSVNRGVGLMGEDVSWCTVLCDDDLLGPGYIDTMVRSAAISGANAVIHSHRVFVDPDGHILRDASPAPLEESAIDYLAGRTGNLRETYLTGVMFSRGAFREIGGYPSFPTGLATDDALIFALALKDRLLFEPRAAASIRIHRDAESQVPADPAVVLESLESFREYCLRAAVGSPGFDTHRRKKLEALIDRYLVRIGSSLWVKNLSSLAESGGMGREEMEIRRLCSFAAENARRFSPRVRLDAFLIRRAGWNPETFSPYVRAWEVLKTIHKMCRSWTGGGATGVV